MRRYPFLRGLPPTVALALAVATTPRAHASGPSGDFEQLIAQADEAVGQGRHQEAVQTYVEAFRAMPAELKPGGVGEFVALAAGKAALDDFAVRKDRTTLVEARAVLTAFVLAVEAADPSTGPASVDAANARIAEIDAVMPAEEMPGDPAVVPADDGAEDVAEDPTASPPTTESDAPPDRSRLGLGLAVGGGVATLAGLGLVIAGARQVPWMKEKLASRGWMEGDPGYDDEIADAERVRNIDIGIGAAAMVIGVGAGVTGAVLMVRSKRGGKEQNVAMAPMLGRDRAGLAATVRF